MPRPLANRNTNYRPSPAPTHISTSVAQGPTLGQSIKDGFGLGIGSAIGHRIVSGVFGAPSVTTIKEPTAFEQCIAKNRDDIAVCAHLAEKQDHK